MKFGRFDRDTSALGDYFDARPSAPPSRKRIDADTSDRIRYLMEERNWPGAKIADEIGFNRHNVRIFCRRNGIKRPCQLRPHRKQSLKLTWEYVRKKIPAHRMSVLTGYNQQQTTLDYKLLLSLTRRERQAVFNMEDDFPPGKKGDKTP
ncbi:hypothetical protein [Vreelandella jeotgali]|uniref:hypothetical protein n=1 Tax=Vreelandella jeotgali TaxID=553386 RepID=UPI000371D6D4|nr:hypothetical protein [Halomonas jeotgali]